MSTKKKQVRENFRDAVFKRDGYKCKFCERTENLDAHHITDRNEMPNGGYVKENGITLCEKHHADAEEWHSSGGKNCPEGFLPADLYKKIFSSHENAVKASLRLK
jgi:5-methylcytosine-specific restriction endonuclease McrA